MRGGLWCILCHEKGGLWVYSLPREGACGSILYHERGLVGLFFIMRGGLWVYFRHERGLVGTFFAMRGGL